MGREREQRNTLLRQHVDTEVHARVAGGKPIRPIVSFRHALTLPVPRSAGIQPNQCAGPAGAGGGGLGFHVESARVRSSDT